MTNEPEWIERFDKEFDYLYQRTEINGTECFTTQHEAVKAFIQDTIKEEKEKAKAELLSKIDEEVDEIETQIFVAETEGDVVPVMETSGYKKALKDVKSILSKYKSL